MEGFELGRNSTVHSFDKSTNGVSTMRNDVGDGQGMENLEQIILSVEILYTTFFAILCPAITVCNVIVITVFAKTKKLNGQSVYKVSIAVSDLMFGLIAIPWFIGVLHTGNTTTVLFNIFWCIERMSLMVSLCAMLAMGFDRLYTVIRLTKFDSNKSKKTAIIVTAVIWCVSTVISVYIDILLPITSRTQDEGNLSDRWWNMVGFTVILATAVLLVWINNFAVYRVVKKKLNAEDLGDSIISTRLKTQRSVVITLCIMTAAFTLSALPLVVYNVIVAQDINNLLDPEYQIPGTVVSICLVTSCVWNCFVYSFRQKEFRDKAKEIFLPCGRDISSGRRQDTPLTHDAAKQ